MTLPDSSGPVRITACQADEHAFTVAELLVVLGILAILALTVLPALAGGRDKATRARCADNLRQLHAASMQFANDNDHWLPWWRLGFGSRENEMTAFHYSRYVWAGEANQFVPPSPSPPAADFQNAGYLYEQGLLGTGRALFCPTVLEGPYSESYYSPLLTSDGAGAIRSSYFYNPRVINAGNEPGQPIDYHRRYEKTTQLEPHKLFASDVVAGTAEWAHAHYAERGWNVLFTDGSVTFSRNDRVRDLVEQVDWNIGPPGRLLDQIFNEMEEER